MTLTFDKEELDSFFNDSPPVDSDSLVDDKMNIPLQSTMTEAMKVDTQSEIKFKKLSRDSGIPVEAVKADPVAIESKINFDKIDFKRLRGKNPHLAEYLDDYGNAIIAHDDIENLSNLERALSPLTDVVSGITGSIGDVASYADITLENFPATAKLGFQLIGKGAELFTTEHDPLFELVKPILELGVDPKSFENIETQKEIVSSGLIEDIEKLKEQRADLMPEDLTLVQEGIRAGLDSLVQMAPGFALTLLSGGSATPMLMTMGAQTFATSYGEGRTEGLSPDTAQWYAGIDAAIEVGTEIMPVKTLEKILTGKSKGLTKDALGFLVKEMGTEQLATLGQSLNQYAFGIDEELKQAKTPQDMIDIQLRRQVITAIATVVAGGAQAGIVVGIRKTVDSFTKYNDGINGKTNTEQNTLDKTNESSEKSNLKKGDKESFREFMQGVNEDSDVFIDGAQTKLYLQTKTAEEVAADPGLQLLQKKVDEAAALGGDVTVPVADFATDITGTESYDALRDHMKLSPETSTPFRQEQEQQEAKNYVETLINEAQESASTYVESQDIFESVRDQLIDTGRMTPQQASVMADIVPAWATVQAQSRGIPVSQVYQESGLHIEGPLTGEAARLAAEAKGVFEQKELLDKVEQSDIFNIGEAERRIEDDIYIHDRLPQGARTASEGSSLEAAATVAKRSLRSVQPAESAGFPVAAGIKGRKQEAGNIRKAETDFLKRWAGQNDLVIPDFEQNLDAATQENAGVELGGRDNYVYLDESGKKWMKANRFTYSPTFADLFDSIALHNEQFPSSEYTLEGFAEVKGEFLPIFSQANIIEDEGITDEQKLDAATKYLENLGYTRTDPSQPIPTTEFTLGDVIVEDIHPGNVIIKDELVYIFDPIIRLNPETKSQRVVGRDIGGERVDIGEEEIDLAALGAVFEQAPAATFYSQLENVITEKMQKKASAQDLLNMIKKGNVKAEEIKWSGVEDYLKDKKTVTKDEVLEYLQANRIEVTEVEKGVVKPIEERASDIGFDMVINQEETDFAEVDTYDLISKTNGLTAATGDIEFITDWIEGQESVRAPDTDKTKFSEYTLPGGENYKELLLTLPTVEAGQVARRAELAELDRLRHLTPTEQAEFDSLVEFAGKKQAFISGHFDEPNILAHIRFNERTDTDGNKVLFLEEVQSDWALEARKKGVKEEITELPEGFEVRKDGDVFRVFNPADEFVGRPGKTEQEATDNALSHLSEAGTVPAAPFIQKNWHELALKRMLRYAAENDFDSVAWISGQQTADRYDLSKELSAVEATKQEDGYRIIGRNKTMRDGVGMPVIDTVVSASELVSTVGKDLADKIIADGGGIYEGVDLKVGGEWAFTLYDKVIPNFLKKYGKKWGAKVGTSELPEVGVEQSIPITDEMKQAVLEVGQPLFQEAKGYYDPANSMIRLTESSDLSTFLHEFAHFMYDMELKNPGSQMTEKIHNWFKRNADDVAKEANSYVGKEGELLEQPEITPAELDIEAYTTKIFKESDSIEIHNAKVEIYDIFEENGLLGIDQIFALQGEDAGLIEEFLESIGDRRTWDEIVEEQRDFEAEEKEDIPEPPSDIFEAAKLGHGLTDDLNEAGYVLPDGDLLDFSGKREGGPPGQRAMDHRQLAFEMAGDKGLSGSDMMIAFQKAGAIRIDNNSGMIDMETLPTASQFSAIREILENNDGGFIDLQDGSRRSSVEIQDPKKAAGIIRRFYKGENFETTTTFFQEEDGVPPTAPEGTGDITSNEVITYLDTGTSGDIAKDSAIERAVHEQFARGFETYLMEGKAPSIELRNVFRTFARWLTQIYRAIQGDLRVNLDKKMRDVFARMIATEEQINAAEARAQFEPMFTDAAMTGMTEEEFQKYQEKQAKAKDKASETLRDKLIKQLTRQTEEWWKEEKKDIVNEEIERLKKEKVYVARDTLLTGEFKLDRKTVKEMVGVERTDIHGKKQFRPPDALRNMTAPGGEGVHPDEAAGFLGYASGDEMINALITTPTIKVVAEENAEREMVNRHGDIMNDGTIEREADEAVQNEERGNLILTELKALSKGTGRAVIERQMLKNMAEENIGKLSFRNIHPGKYRKAEIRAAQESAAALAAGNKEEAATAKARQALNFYLGKAATEAKSDTIKIVDRMARYKKKSVREAIMKAGNGYWEQLTKVLNRFEFRKAATLTQVDRLNVNIAEWAKARIEDGDGLVLTPEILDESYVTHWKNIPYDALIGVNDSVKNIEHVAKYSNKITRLQEEMDFKKLVQIWTDSINKKVKTEFPTVASVADKPSKAAHNARWGNSQMTKMPFIASWLDGFERVGISHDILIQPVNDNYDEEMKLIAEYAKPVTDAILNRSKEQVIHHNRKYYIPEIKGKAKHTGNLMGHEILALAMSAGNLSNLKKMLLGEEFANPDVEAEISFENPTLQAVLQHMTHEDWKFAQLTWDQMNKLFPLLEKVHKEETGAAPPKIEATPIKTKFGEFAGGYYPMKYDPNRSIRAKKNEDRLIAETESMFIKGSLQQSINASATNERTGFYDPVLMDLNIIPTHFQETIHYITHHKTVRELNKLFNDPTVAQTIKEKLGPEEFAQFRPWLSDIAKEGRNAPTKTWIGSTVKHLRFGTTLGIMGFKASTGIIQILGLTAAMTEVGPVNMFQAVRYILGNTTDMQGAWDFAADNSKIMRHRTDTMDREIHKARQQLKDTPGKFAAVQETSMKHIMLIQTYLVDLPSWHAAYIKGMKEWGDEQRAYNYADFVVEQFQGSGITKDMAALFRTKNPPLEMMTMFMTFFSSQWNIQRDIARGARLGIYSPTTVAAKLMFLYTIPVFLEMLLRGDFGDDDDDETNLQKYLTNLALYPVQSLPFIRDAATATLGEYGYNISPVAQIIKTGTESIPAIIAAPFTDEEVTKNQAKGATKFIGAVVGVPGINQAWATGEHLYDVMVEGEELTLNQLLYGPRR